MSANGDKRESRRMATWGLGRFHQEEQLLVGTLSPTGGTARKETGDHHPRLRVCSIKLAAVSGPVRGGKGGPSLCPIPRRLLCVSSRRKGAGRNNNRWTQAFSEALPFLAMEQAAIGFRQGAPSQKAALNERVIHELGSGELEVSTQIIGRDCATGVEAI